VDIRPVPPQSPDARRLLAEYLDDLQRRIGDGWARAGYVDATPDELLPPAGALLVGYEDGEAVACGAMHVIAPGIAELKRMFVAPRFRGRGLGRALLDALERTSVELGCDVARLDSTEPLVEAVALYRSAGYVEIGDYNQNPNATTWMERRLRQPPGAGRPL
jgi:GNAT superfamily N-acetyltransferase